MEIDEVWAMLYLAEWYRHLRVSHAFNHRDVDSLVLVAILLRIAFLMCGCEIVIDDVRILLRYWSHRIRRLHRTTTLLIQRISDAR